jgi:hypothetical protein
VWQAKVDVTSIPMPDVAAARIQAKFRGKQTRRAIAVIAGHALRLQCAIRRMLARKKLRMQAVARAAMRIQCRARRMRDRRRLEAILPARALRLICTAMPVDSAEQQYGASHWTVAVGQGVESWQTTGGKSRPRLQHWQLSVVQIRCSNLCSWGHRCGRRTSRQWRQGTPARGVAGMGSVWATARRSQPLVLPSEIPL